MPFAKFVGESKKTPGKLVITLKVDGEDEEFTPPQVLAMLLGQLQRDAVAETPNIKTSDLVVSVPCWFTDAQRHQVLEACEIANLNCYGLINDTTAVALNYGIWKNARGAFKGEDNYYVMFINFGATQYSVQIVKFSEGKMTVKSTTYDRFLGGRVIDMAIADKLVEGFKEQTKGLDASRSANPKAYIKLLLQAEKAKKNLCGGIPAIKVNCECLMEDRDLSNFLLKKEDLEEICKPLAERMIPPIERALAETGLQFSDLKSIEATGGTMRMPIFKQTVGKYFNLPQEPPNYGLMTTMDMDESAGSGCALMCAMLSPKFNVKPFEVIDAVQYPVNISWDKPGREVAEDDNKMDIDEDGEQDTSINTSGTNELVLFQRNGRIGSRKIAFRRNKPFTLQASYTDATNASPDFPGGRQEVAKFVISGMPEQGAGGEVPRIRVYLKQDISGVVRAESALYMEEKVDEPEPVAAEEGKKEGEETAPEGTEEAKKDDKESAEVEEPPKKKKKRYKRVSLNVEATYFGATARSTIIDQQSREANLANTDRLIRETSDARNDLETFVYDFRDKLDRSLKTFSTEDERSSLNDRLAKEEDWLYTDEADEAKKSDFQNKLKELQTLVNPIVVRESEANGRENACNELRKLTEEFLRLVNGSEEKYAHLTDEDRDEVRNACHSAQQWLSDEQEKQMSLPSNVDPSLKIADISNRWSEVNKKCKPIVNKKKPEPKKEEEPAKTEEGAAKDAEGKKEEGAQDGENSEAKTEKEGDEASKETNAETEGE